MKCLHKEGAYSNGQCKACRREYQANYRKVNPDKSRLAVRRASDKSRFGHPRESIIKRSCERCGGATNLSIHHKDGNGRGSKMPNNSNKNFETLCNDCHIAHHVKQWSKKHSVKWQERVKALPGLSLREVGRRLGIDKGTVKSIRRQTAIDKEVDKEMIAKGKSVVNDFDDKKEVIVKPKGKKCCKARSSK